MLSLVPGARGVRTILCLGAHCDDIEIGCGGTIARLVASSPGIAVHWIVFSSGPVRAGEAKTAAGAFLSEAAEPKVRIEDFRNGYFPFVGDAIKNYFEELKQRVDPDLILTHYRDDRHQDHRVISDLSWNTFRDHLILEYEIPKYDGDMGRPNAYVPLSDEVRRAKVDWLMEHFPSQHSRPWFRRETFDALMRLRGMECNAPSGYAEAFHARKLVLE